MCSFTQVENGLSYNVASVTLSGSGHVPKASAVDVPWHSNVVISPSFSGDAWEANSYAVDDSAASLGGDYHVRQARVDRRDGSDIPCEEYGATTFQLEFGASGPPPMPEDSEGVREDKLWCEAGTSISSRFQLAAIPGQSSLVPLFKGADAGVDPSYAGLEFTTVRVVDWGDADELTLRYGDRELRLHPGPAKFSVPGGGAWLYSARWSSDATVGELPVIELEGGCVLSPATRAVSLGYTADVTELAPWLDVDARLVARIVPDASSDREHLMFEVEGTGFSQGVVLTANPDGSSSFDMSTDWLDAWGTVRVDQDGMVVELIGGSFSGVGDLAGRSLTLPRYGS